MMSNEAKLYLECLNTWLEEYILEMNNSTPTHAKVLNDFKGVYFTEVPETVIKNIIERLKESVNATTEQSLLDIKNLLSWDTVYGILNESEWEDEDIRLINLLMYEIFKKYNLNKDNIEEIICSFSSVANEPDSVEIVELLKSYKRNIDKCDLDSLSYDLSYSIIDVITYIRFNDNKELILCINEDFYDPNDPNIDDIRVLAYFDGKNKKDDKN